MFKAAVLLASVAVALAQNQPQITCDGSKMKACTIGLANLWGLPPANLDNFWTDRGVFEATLRTVYNGAKLENYVKVCNGISLFYHCNGRENNRFCLGISGLTNTKMNAFDAYQMEGILNRIRFECGDAFYAVTGYADAISCIITTKINYGSELGTATSKYEDAIQHDTYANICPNAVNFVQNVSSVFNNKGPCKEVADPAVRRTASWFGCEGARQHVLAQYKHCANVLKC